MFISLGWTLRDYAKRVWDNSGEDNVLFLAGGIAFNLILAALPFILLLVAGVTLLLPIVYRGTINSQQAVADFLDRILPTHAETPDSPYHKLVFDLLRTRNTITLYSANSSFASSNMTVVKIAATHAVDVRTRRTGRYL